MFMTAQHIFNSENLPEKLENFRSSLPLRKNSKRMRDIHEGIHTSSFVNFYLNRINSKAVKALLQISTFDFEEKLSFFKIAFLFFRTRCWDAKSIIHRNISIKEFAQLVYFIKHFRAHIEAVKFDSYIKRNKKFMEIFITASSNTKIIFWSDVIGNKQIFYAPVLQKAKLCKIL